MQLGVNVQIDTLRPTAAARYAIHQSVPNKTIEKPSITGEWIEYYPIVATVMKEQIFDSNVKAG